MTTARQSLASGPMHAASALGLAFSMFAGCQLHDSGPDRLMAVESRFTANPLEPPKDQAVAILPQQSARTKVGLTMQSAPDPVHVDFASRLGTVLTRELQLSAGSFAVQPLTSLTVKTATRDVEMATPSDVKSVSFHEPQDGLYPDLPPNPLLMSSAPPIVDQILVVRVIEYRAYYPMLATLEIRVLDGESQDPIFTTTSTWSGTDYQLVTDQTRRKWFHGLLRKSGSCDPSPGHNSPQVLMHEIAGDISDWYTEATNPQPLPKKSGKVKLPAWMKSSKCSPAGSCPP